MLKSTVFKSAKNCTSPSTLFPAKTLSMTFVRYKRTKGKELSSNVKKAITQMSVLSANRKQPKRLKLCPEDLIKHETIQRCWAEYQRDVRAERNQRLEAQYASMDEAMSVLQQLSPELYEAANKKDMKHRFPKEFRIPTEYPPNKIWYYEYQEGDGNTHKKK
ncbi:hypothetical protein ACO0QE_000681 [Hanseniaspora vineae]